jgi:hypothetical protein
MLEGVLNFKHTWLVPNLVLHFLPMRELILVALSP